MWLINKVLEALTIFGNQNAPIEDFEAVLNIYGSNANFNFNENELSAIKQSWSPKFLESLEAIFAPQSKLETSFVQPKLHSSTDPKFELFTLTDFPNYQLRIKEPESLHTDKVQQYSGYIDILDEDKHFFFWFYESRNDPKNDPLVLWLNGGPGCSSSTGQFFELGPGFVNKSLEIEYNPHAWNNHANILFLDQPVNVGYSYSKNRVDNSRVAGKDVYAFLEIFMQSFPQYTGNGFHISGESYAGMYLPAIGKAILDHKDRSFNLSSALIGNPITDPALQSFSSVAMACGDGGYPSVLSEEQCSSLYGKVPVCESLMQKCYDTEYNKFVCGVAQAYCSSLDEPYIQTGRNPYDISDQCGDDCYPEINYIEEYMRKPEVIKAVGSDIDNFVGCSNEVGLDFLAHLDGARNEGPDVLYMLENGIDVLFYDGALDWICSWPGVYRLVERLRYEHHSEFVNKPVSIWEVDGKPAGETKKVANLAWMKVYGAGHMVPHDRGKQAEQMLSQWLADRKFTSN